LIPEQGVDWVQSLTEPEIARRLSQVSPLPAGEIRGDAPFVPPHLLERYAPEPRPAAVLIPLLREGEEWRLLFTRRTSSLAEHSGQVAFPGGRADFDDPGPEATALREAQEEIGVNPAHVRILGRLHDYLTITNYRVTPVVGVIPWPYPLLPASHEVERVFTIPLAWLANPANHEQRQRILPAPYPSIPVIYFQPYDQEILWGASARFTLALLEALKAPSPA
jgi:8-oxo-dGTP pyrophosphatase MutT (NUDIX family)